MQIEVFFNKTERVRVPIHRRRPKTANLVHSERQSILMEVVAIGDKTIWVREPGGRVFQRKEGRDYSREALEELMREEAGVTLMTAEEPGDVR